jgi:hypothetical protein
VVRAVDTGRVVDRVGVDEDAVQRGLDAAELGQPEVAALAHDLDPKVGAVHPDRVVGLVADVRVALGRRLDVGADPAVPQQVRLGGQDRAEYLLRGHGLGVLAQIQRPRHLRGDRDRLRRPRVHPAARADQRRVVVRPGRAGQLEQPTPLGEGDLGIRIGVEEDVPVVERREQADVP